MIDSILSRFENRIMWGSPTEESRQDRRKELDYMTNYEFLEFISDLIEERLQNERYDIEEMINSKIQDHLHCGHNSGY